jgi:hypothetical protein
MDALMKRLLPLLGTFMLTCTAPTHGGAFSRKVKKWSAIARSATTFHLTSYVNARKHGEFNFTQIANEPETRVTDQGIIGINDGKKTPLLLGTIPRKKKHIKTLRSLFHLNTSNGIGIFAFNRPFECKWAGLCKLAKKDRTLTVFKYPTIDYTPPTFIDLIRTVRDLENRDTHPAKLAYVHCKGGKGRSATGVAAYLLHTLHKAGIEVTLEQIQQYLKARRPQVDIIKRGRPVLSQFATELKQAGTFENLYAKYKNEVDQREQHVNSIRYA